MEWDKLPLTVLKFGGSSVADSARMRHVAQIVKKTREEGYRVAVVVSAMGNTTDDLLALASDVASEADGREMDQLLATGEQQSVALLALALKQFGLPAQSFTAQQAGMVDGATGKAETTVDGFSMETNCALIEFMRALVRKKLDD